MRSQVCGTLRVIETCLDTVVAIRVSQQFLKARAIQKFFNEHFTCAVLSHPNALDTTQRPEMKKGELNAYLFNNIGAEFLH